MCDGGVGVGSGVVSQHLILRSRRLRLPKRTWAASVRESGPVALVLTRYRNGPCNEKPMDADRDVAVRIETDDMVA